MALSDRQVSGVRQRMECYICVCIYINRYSLNTGDGRLEIAEVEGLFVDGDVAVDILRADDRVVEDVDEHCNYEPVAVDVAEVTADPVLDVGHDTTADYHHHEDAGCFGCILTEALGSEVEDAAPHYRCAETAEEEE